MTVEAEFASSLPTLLLSVGIKKETHQITDSVDPTQRHCTLVSLCKPHLMCDATQQFLSCQPLRLFLFFFRDVRAVGF